MVTAYKDKVFIKHFGKVVETPAAAETEQQNFLVWTAEEDIKIIGIQGCIRLEKPNENDSYHYCAMEVSQTGVLAGAGILCEVWATAWWNTAPPGIHSTSECVNLMLPKDKAITLGDGDSLYINSWAEGVAVGTAKFSGTFKVFYTKG